MTLQTMYDWIKTNPKTTANLPRHIRRAPVGVPYERAARLEQLGFVDSVQIIIRGRKCTGYVARIDAPDEYRHGGELVLKK